MLATNSLVAFTAVHRACAIVVSLCAFLLCAPTAFASTSITVDNAASSTYNGSSGTLSFTTSGTNRMLLVSVAEVVPTSVTYNGVSMTKVTSTPSTSVWYLINPASGTHDISVTASSGGFSVQALSLDNVDQTTGIGAVAQTNPNVNATSGSLS